MNIDKLILKFTWQGPTRPSIVNILLKEKNLILLKFKTSSEATVIKTVWNLQKNGQVNQWNRRESQETDPHKYSQTHLCQRGRGNSVEDCFLTNGAGAYEHHMQKSVSRHRPLTCHKNELKMDHRHKCKTLNYKTTRRYNRRKSK